MSTLSPEVWRLAGQATAHQLTGLLSAAGPSADASRVVPLIYSDKGGQLRMFRLPRARDPGQEVGRYLAGLAPDRWVTVLDARVSTRRGAERDALMVKLGDRDGEEQVLVPYTLPLKAGKPKGLPEDPRLRAAFEAGLRADDAVWSQLEDRCDLLARPRSAYLLLFFHGPADLSDAERALRGTALTVERDGDTLQARRGKGPVLTISLTTAPAVAGIAREFAEERHLPALAACDRCFMVRTDDIDATLYEAATLAEVELRLRVLDRAWCYYTWSDQFRPPGGASGARGSRPSAA
jgi:hypothetical protein